MTHQRHFLPHCDRILVLKGGRERALGTYSQLASSALTELTQLEEETELDDAVYDDQIPTQAASPSSQPIVDGPATKPFSAFQAINAGPIQATLDAEVPAAVVATSQTAQAADHLITGQQVDSGLASSVPPDSLATLATATTAATAVAAAGTGLNAGHATATATPAVQPTHLPSETDTAAAPPNPEHLARQQQGQGRKQQAAFSPAVVAKKKYVLPPRVDQRWGPVKLCEKWYFRLRGYRKAHKPEDEGVVEEEEGKQQAQLNQQEGRATGVHYQKKKKTQQTTLSHKPTASPALHRVTRFINDIQQL